MRRRNQLTRCGRVLILDPKRTEEILILVRTPLENFPIDRFNVYRKPAGVSLQLSLSPSFSFYLFNFRIISLPEFSTEDKLEYQFHPVSGGIVRFKVRAEHDAHLALTTGPAESDPMIEVFLGGWKNTKSVVRKNRTKPDVVEVDTPGILNAGEFRGFWIRWTHDGIITVGREDEVAAFMSWEDPDHVNFQFVGVCTGWGATGCWKIEGNTTIL